MIWLINGNDFRSNNSRTGFAEFQIFAAQTLFNKLSDDVHQIFEDQQRCLQLCRFLTTQCLLLPSPKLNKAVRLRLSECLGIAVVTFLGAHWPTALTDILNVSQFDSSSGTGLSSNQLISAINLIHAIGVLPDLVTSLEYKKTLMHLLGHRTYTPWRKTTAAKKLKTECAVAADAIAVLLGRALNVLEECQRLGHSSSSVGRVDNPLNDERTLASDLIHESLISTINWSKAFDMPLIMSSPKFSDSQMIWKLLSVYGGAGDPSLAELFGATIPSLSLSQSRPGATTSNQKPFVLDSLGKGRGVVEPLLAFFSQKLLSPLSIICESNSNPSLDRLGRSSFLS